jgi:hypothetical protein
MSAIITPPCVLNFPRLFKPSTIGKEGKGEPDYGMVALFPEPMLETEAWQNLKKAVSECASDKFGADKMKDPAFRAQIKDNLPIKDAAKKEGQWNGFQEGRKFITMKRKAEYDRPQIVDAKGNEIIEESLLFAGCIVRCGVRFYAWEYSGRVGVSCTVDMVQLLRGGKDVKRLDNRPDAKKVFAGEGVDEEGMGKVLAEMGVPEGALSPGSSSDAGEDLDF